MPAWFGTRWEFYGTTQEPRSGAIACGYYVSTLLEHAGLKVERVYMAKQASEHIVRTFADRSRVTTLRGVEPADVAQHITDVGPGLYAVGLSFHTGFLVWDGSGDVELCHSAYYKADGVVCEPAADSQGLSDSGIFVIGPVLTDTTPAPGSPAPTSARTATDQPGRLQREDPGLPVGLERLMSSAPTTLWSVASPVGSASTLAVHALHQATNSPRSWR